MKYVLTVFITLVVVFGALAYLHYYHEQNAAETKPEVKEEPEPEPEFDIQKWFKKMRPKTFIEASRVGALQ